MFRNAFVMVLEAEKFKTEMLYLVRAFWLYHPMVEGAVAGEPAGEREWGMNPSFYQKLTGKITNPLL